MSSRRGFASIGLFNPKCRWNIGGVLRASHCYGASLIVTCGNRGCWNPALTDTTRAHKHVPIINVHTLEDFRKCIPKTAVPIAVDIVPGARNICGYVHPERAFYIFGPEDGTLGHKIIDFCRDVIYVPTNHCMNLAATANVILYDRCVKRGDLQGV